MKDKNKKNWDILSTIWKPSNTFSNEEITQVNQEIRYYDMIQALRKARKELNLTQQQLANNANMPRSTISKVESGIYNATLETLLMMANALGKKVKLVVE